MPVVLDTPRLEPHGHTVATEHLPATNRTTLFELVSALQDAAGPDNDVTVVAAVADLLQSGRIQWAGHDLTRNRGMRLIMCNEDR